MRPKSATRPKPAVTDFPPAVSSLVQQADVDAANRLQEMGGGDGAEAKSARRALYLLKQRGIEPSASTPLAGQLDGTAPARSPVTGYLSNVSGNASQMAFFEEPDPYGGAPMYHFFLTNFASGLEDVTSRRISRRELPAILDRLKRGEGGVITEAPADYVRYLVRQAADRIVEAGGRIPQGYADAMRRIGPAEQTFSRPLVYDFIDPGSLPEDLSFSREPEPFFQSPFFRSWFLAMQAVAGWEEKYFEAVQSRFAVDQAAREALGEKVIAEAADDLLDPAALKSLRRALEEQSTVLHLSGSETEAKQALFHALSIDPEEPASKNSLVLFYVKRSIFVVMAYKAEQEPEPEDEPEQTAEKPLIERA